jgi:DNA mismatch endonuclease (patch repair protein)
MVDTLSSARRSWLMGRVRQKNTTPEMSVRREAHRLGYRFRLHRKDLPGSPDLVFPRLRKAIFVHGCFWHRHDCRKATVPKANAEFWTKKFVDNQKRDRKVLEQLGCLGWDATVIWECEAKDPAELTRRLRVFLGEVS